VREAAKRLTFRAMAVGKYFGNKTEIVPDNPYRLNAAI